MGSDITWCQETVEGELIIITCYVFWSHGYTKGHLSSLGARCDIVKVCFFDKRLRRLHTLHFLNIFDWQSDLLRRAASWKTEIKSIVTDLFVLNAGLYEKCWNRLFSGVTVYSINDIHSHTHNPRFFGHRVLFGEIHEGVWICEYECEDRRAISQQLLRSQRWQNPFEFLSNTRCSLSKQFRACTSVWKRFTSRLWEEKRQGTVNILIFY